MLKKNSLIVLFVVAALSWMVSGCTENELVGPSIGSPENIRVGFLTEITNKEMELSPSYHALLLAAEEINNAGGIEGKNIEIITRDSFEGFGVAAKEAVKELHNAGIDFIIGPGWSSLTMAISDDTIANNMLLMPTSATSPLISELDDNGLIWRACPSDAFPGVVAADYVYNTMGKRNVGIIFRDDTWGSAYAAAFGEGFEALGGAVSSFVDYPADTEDFSVYDFSENVDELIAGHPELIFYTTITEAEHYGMLNELYSKSIYQEDKPITFAVEGLTAISIVISVPEDMANRMMAIEATVDESPTSQFTQYRNNHLSKYPDDVPGIYNAVSYDELYLIAYGMIKSGTTTDARDVAAELKDLSGGVDGATVVHVNEFARAKAILESGGVIDYDGASGRIEFDENGDPGSATFEITKMENLEEVLVALINYP